MVQKVELVGQVQNLAYSVAFTLEKQEPILFSELPAIGQILEWAWMVAHLEGQIWIQNYKDNGKLCHTLSMAIQQ